MFGLAHQIGAIAIALADDGNGELADDVAAHDQDIDAVMLRRIDEFPEGALRAMKVGAEEQLGGLVFAAAELPTKERHLPPVVAGSGRSLFCAWPRGLRRRAPSRHARSEERR